MVLPVMVRPEPSTATSPIPKSFGDYALRTVWKSDFGHRSNLHPVDGVSALLQRDIVKEVRDAGVRVLQTDVAWVGDGYSFGLNSIYRRGAHHALLPDARPFISLDGWAGSQRYAGIWSGATRRAANGN